MQIRFTQSPLTSYKEKYARLIEDIRLAKQQRFSPSSEKNVLQPDIFDEAGVELPDEVKEQLEEETNVNSYTRKKRPIRRLLPAYLPREVVVHDISEIEKIGSCGEHLVRIGEEVSEQLKYVSVINCMLLRKMLEISAYQLMNAGSFGIKNPNRFSMLSRYGLIIT